MGIQYCDEKVVFLSCARYLILDMLALISLLFSSFCCFTLCKNRNYTFQDWAPIMISFMWTIVIFIHQVFMQTMKLLLICIFVEICTFIMIAYMISCIYHILIEQDNQYTFSDHIRKALKFFTGVNVILLFISTYLGLFDVVAYTCQNYINAIWIFQTIQEHALLAYTVFIGTRLINFINQVHRFPPHDIDQKSQGKRKSFVIASQMKEEHSQEKIRQVKYLLVTMIITAVIKTLLDIIEYNFLNDVIICQTHNTFDSSTFLGNLSLILGQLSIIFASFAIPYIFVIIPQFRGINLKSISSVDVEDDCHPEDCISSPQYDQTYMFIKRISDSRVAPDCLSADNSPVKNAGRSINRYSKLEY